MKRAKIQLRLLGTLVVCVVYVFIYFRKDLDDANTLFAVVIAGVLALGSFLYSAFSPRVHHRVTKVLVGFGALVATFCAGAFVHYTWMERVRLKESALLGMLLFFSLLSCVAAVIAWVAFWTCKWSPTCETTAQEPHAPATKA